MKLKIWLLSFVLLMGGTSCKDGKRYHDQQTVALSVKQEDPLAEILKFQQELNEQFRDPERSPLTQNDLLKFKGLDFFKPDTTYRVIARLNRTPEALPFLMPTTTDRQSRERVYGLLSFNIDGINYELEVYQNLDLLQDEEYTDYLFLPFTDTTNGNETYEGGRYIDLSIPEGDSLLIDFNKSYNPYCVYNEKYSCPIVPKVNHLSTDIKAGIKSYKKKRS